jgi:hypothetical protein
MAIIVKVKSKPPSEIIDIVRELRAQGLVQGKDFDFSYNPETWDNFTMSEEKHTVFTFYDERWGTWFTLKWS